MAIETPGVSTSGAIGTPGVSIPMAIETTGVSTPGANEIPLVSTGWGIESHECRLLGLPEQELQLRKKWCPARDLETDTLAGKKTKRNIRKIPNFIEVSDFRAK